ncbi:MAG TPA: hypothetical protein VH208_11055, partial [Myxococcaceae bacterium]|nr:hypothetical protein [Myxococcaceae bacterium]
MRTIGAGPLLPAAAIVAVAWASVDGTLSRGRWFAAVLGLCGLWAIAHVLARRPLRRADAGLWMIAGGLALGLAGGAMSRAWAVRGRVDLSSGQRNDAAVLDAPAELEAPGAWAGRVQVLRRLRFAQRVPIFRVGAPDVAAAAIAFRVETPTGDTTAWLSDARSPEIDLGDAHLIL